MKPKTDAPGRWLPRRGLPSLVLVLALLGGGLATAILPGGPLATLQNETGSSFPPGTSADGVEDASALVDAHRTALSSSGTFVVVETVNATRPPGTPRPDRWLWNQTAVHRVDLRASPPRVTQRRVVVANETRQSMEITATPTTWRTRRRAGTGNWTTHTSTRNLTAAAFRTWARSYTLPTVLADHEFTYVGQTERGNATVYRFESVAYHGDRVRGNHTLPNTVRRAGATLLVDGRGQVVAVENWYAGPTRAVTESGDEVQVNATVRYRWRFATTNGTAG